MDINKLNEEREQLLNELARVEKMLKDLETRKKLVSERLIYLEGALDAIRTIQIQQQSAPNEEIVNI
jgi:hypothetical protein